VNIRAGVIALLIAACAAPSASAAPWQRVTTPDGGSTDQVGLARTGDGALHLAWSHPTGPNTEDLLHTVISGERADAADGGVARRATLCGTSPVRTASRSAFPMTVWM